jgi:hypothetical protein
MSTIDLHDLATILLRERLLTEPRFKHAHLREVNDGSVPRTLLRDTPLPVLDSLPKNIPHVAYFLFEDNTRTPEEDIDLIKVTYTGGSPLTATEFETLFWTFRHHDSGYTLAHAMQLVLDALPADTQLRIRTSQGHVLTVPATSFSIVEVPIIAHTNTYICKLRSKGVSGGTTGFNASQYTMGESGSFPWVYLLFSDEGSTEEQDSSVVLDLVSPMLGFRGLGGEIFSMERQQEYLAKLLPRGAFLGRPFKNTSRIVYRPGGLPIDEAVALSERVFSKLKRGEGMFFCAYCGKEMVKLLCTACRKVRYCDKGCQVKGWKYHKNWCKTDARTDGRCSAN